MKVGGASRDDDAAGDWLKSADVIRANDARLTTREISVHLLQETTGVQPVLSNRNNSE